MKRAENWLAETRRIFNDSSGEKDMMRMTGIFIMGIAVAGAGFLAAEYVKERLEILCIFRKMVYHLKGRILYSNDTLPEALGEVGMHFSEEQEEIRKEPGEFLIRVSRKLEQRRNVSLAKIWNEELERVSADLPISKTDQRNLAELGENLGYADRDMQEQTLFFYLEQTDEAIEGLKREVETLGKLYRTLGIAAGMFLVIVLA